MRARARTKLAIPASTNPTAPGISIYASGQGNDDHRPSATAVTRAAGQNSQRSRLHSATTNGAFCAPRQASRDPGGLSFDAQLATMRLRRDKE